MRRRAEQIRRLDKALRDSGVCDCASPTVLLCKKKIDAYERGELKQEPCPAGCPPEKKLVVSILFVYAGECWCAGCANGKDVNLIKPEDCQCGTCGYCAPFPPTPARLPEPETKPLPVTPRASDEAPEAFPGTIEGRARDRTVELFPKRRPRQLEDRRPIQDMPDCVGCSHPSRLHPEWIEGRPCTVMLVLARDGMSNGPCSCTTYTR